MHLHLFFSDIFHFPFLSQSFGCYYVIIYLNSNFLCDLLELFFVLFKSIIRSSAFIFTDVVQYDIVLPSKTILKMIIMILCRISVESRDPGLRSLYGVDQSLGDVGTGTTGVWCWVWPMCWSVTVRVPGSIIDAMTWAGLISDVIVVAGVEPGMLYSLDW